jgi:glucose-6-phosphate isomerase
VTSHAARLSSVPTRELFARDPGRFERFSHEKVGLLMDFSRQRFDEIVLQKLLEFVDTVGMRARIDAMWRGDKINTTEDRSVLHVAPRQPTGAKVCGADIEKTVMTERNRMLGFADLGPAMAVLALKGSPRAA